MLSIYKKKARPQKAFQEIISACTGFEAKTLKKWHKIETANSDYIFIILSGEVEIRRKSDDLCLAILEKEFIYGITNFFDNDSSTYGVVRSETVIRIIKKQEFEHIITKNALWQSMSAVMAWYLALLRRRDEVLVARSAYSVIREFLLEINELAVLNDRDINIYDYIQEYTNLARSTIIKILSELKKGQYITVEKGKLLSMTSLPEKY